MFGYAVEVRKLCTDNVVEVLNSGAGTGDENRLCHGVRVQGRMIFFSSCDVQRALYGLSSAVWMDGPSEVEPVLFCT